MAVHPGSTLIKSAGSLTSSLKMPWRCLQAVTKLLSLQKEEAKTAGSSLTAQQPENNIIRVTMQALSAVLGGTQSLHTNSMDEAYCLPTEQSVQLALRTQQIIAHESNITSTIDPLAGSYLVEYITDEIEKGVVKYLEKIDKMGGVISAIENGFIQKEIHLSAYDMQKKIEDNENIVDDYYAKHTHRFNTGSIEVAVCCMYGPEKAHLTTVNIPLRKLNLIP